MFQIPPAAKECAEYADMISYSVDDNDGSNSKHGGKQFEAIFSATDNSLSVSFSQVPEPSTYAAIFGALSLVLAAYKRRK